MDRVNSSGRKGGRKEKVSNVLTDGMCAHISVCMCLWCACMHVYVHTCAHVYVVHVCILSSCIRVGVGGRWKLHQATKGLRCMIYVRT